MTPPSPPELFASERPVRSDFARANIMREKAYARRRKITLVVLAVLIGGGAYALVGHHKTDPANIPTIHADAGDYKQKPADPGGIDIPHQDVQVYDQLEGKNGTPAEVEHLLPPPEKPKDLPPPQTQATAAPVLPAPPLVVAPAPAAIAPVITPAPHAAPVASVSKSDNIIPAAPVKQVATTVTPAVVPVPPEALPAVAPTPAPPPEPTIEQIIANTKNAASMTPASSTAAPSSGSFAIQLASVPDQAKAQSMIQDMQKKYAAQLGGTTLQATRADLGSRGIFYRIQSQTMAEADATSICAALKQQNTGCILVRK